MPSLIAFVLAVYPTSMHQPVLSFHISYLIPPKYAAKYVALSCPVVKYCFFVKLRIHVYEKAQTYLERQ